MASENETVESAIDAVRKMIHDCPAIKGGLGEFGYQLKANGAIDRIEAAHKREVAELREYLKANTVGVKAMHEEIETLRGMITDLRAKLKVAEDALKLCISGMCGECSRQHPGETCVNGCCEMLTAKNALAAIREEGGGKPIRNCDRFETAEDAYNACPQFCDIDVKTMTDRELKIVEAITKCLEWLFAPIAEKGKEH